MNFCAFLPRAHSIGVCHPRRVDIAAIRFKHDTPDAIEVDQRVQAFGLIPGDLMKIHPIKLGFGRLQAQLMFACLGLRQVQRPGLEHATALPGFGL